MYMVVNPLSTIIPFIACWAKMLGLLRQQIEYFHTAMIKHLFKVDKFIFGRGIRDRTEVLKLEVSSFSC